MTHLIPALIAIVAFQQAPPVRDAIVQPTVGTASISGQVVNDEEEPKPVRRAIVTLTGPDLRPSRGVVTDDDGRFTIANLPAGRVTLTVTRASYITSVYGAKRPGRPGTAIALAAGEAVTGLVVKAWRGGVIAGILRDHTGTPVEGISVTVMAARTNGTPRDLPQSRIRPIMFGKDPRNTDYRQECIDLAAHWVADANWGMPDDAGSTFDELADRNAISRELEGTRIAVHDVIGLLHNGETVDTLTITCLPTLTKAQVYKCLAYYEDHRGEVDLLVARQMAHQQP